MNGIFIENVEKAKALMSDILGSDYSERYDLKTKVNTKDSTFELIIDKGSSTIKASLKGESKEILQLTETFSKRLYPEDIPKEYDLAIEYTKDFLEKEYDINFLMLDPEDKDDNIQEIGDKSNWHVIFTHEDLLGKIKATLQLENDCPIIQIEKEIKRDITLV